MSGTRIETNIDVVMLEEMDITLTKTVPDPEKTSDKEVLVCKAVKFKCYICKKFFSSILGVRGHIGKVHGKKDADEMQKKFKEKKGKDEEGEKRQRL